MSDTAKFDEIWQTLNRKRNATFASADISDKIRMILLTDPSEFCKAFDHKFFEHPSLNRPESCMLCDKEVTFLDAWGIEP